MPVTSRWASAHPGVQIAAVSLDWIAPGVSAGLGIGTPGGTEIAAT
jgi:hypothetical protein